MSSLWILLFWCICYCSWFSSWTILTPASLIRFIFKFSFIHLSKLLLDSYFFISLSLYLFILHYNYLFFWNIKAMPYNFLLLFKHFLLALILCKQNLMTFFQFFEFFFHFILGKDCLSSNYFVVSQSYWVLNYLGILFLDFFLQFFNFHIHFN